MSKKCKFQLKLSFAVAMFSGSVSCVIPLVPDEM